MMTKTESELIEKVSKISAKTAVEAALDFMEKEKQRQEAEKRDRRLRNTKLLLRNYRNLKKHCESIPEDLKTFDNMIILDEFGTSELEVESIKRSKQRTWLMVKFTERMLSVYEKLCKESNREEDLRRYQTIYHLYVSDEKQTAREVAECHNVDERTVYRDVDEACKALSSLIFGIDSLKFT